MASECTKEHCFHCFDTLFCYLNPQETPIELGFVDDKFPLFVTWSKLTNGDPSSARLRGCIGSFSALPLREGLAEYALISAIKDSRFYPITNSELESLECGVSLLTDFQDVPTYLDWEIGKHGIYITFPHPASRPVLPSADSSADTTPASSTFALNKTKKTSYKPQRMLSATYLPDVIPAQGWTKVEAVDSAIHKAGYDGKITEDIRRSVNMRTYESKVATVTWDEYWAWRTEKLAA